ncbi:MAG: hypothetical protein ACPHJ3_09180 [Rubripirellula sp.]
MEKIETLLMMLASRFHRCPEASHSRTTSKLPKLTQPIPSHAKVAAKPEDQRLEGPGDIRGASAIHL